VTTESGGGPLDDGIGEDDDDLDATDLGEEDDEEVDEDDEDDFDDEDAEDVADDEDYDGAEEEAYEPGDVNAVAGGGYEAGDVNTIEAGAPRGRGARAQATHANGGTPVAVLSYLAQSMADDPEAVVIRQEERRGSTVLRLHVAPRDMGRVIGRRGRTAQAIRTLVAAAAARDGVQVAVDIADD
jgi:uncharacterized protein